MTYLHCSLRKRWSFFSYKAKNERPFKVVLTGLDIMDVVVLRQNLVDAGLEVMDVKLVNRKADFNREIILYIVYLKKGTTTMHVLREKYSSINHIRIKWDYQTKNPNKITQCYNCQLFGHGSDRCRVNTFCAKCAGNHRTRLCTSDIIKCANCHGDHPSTDVNCPNRFTYLNMREKLHNRGTKSTTQPQKFSTFTSRMVKKNVSFADATRVNHVPVEVNNATSNGKNDLFTIEELKEITIELITNLKSCNTKLEQFNVISNLAFKFLT